MSGLDPIRNSILSIGAVDFEHPSRTFYGECRIRKGASFSRQALAVNGFTVSQIYDGSKPSCKELVSSFRSWAAKCRDRTIAGHNVHIDIAFLNRSFRLYGLESMFGFRNIDTHSLTYAHIMSRGIRPPIKNGRTNVNSEYVFNYVGIGSEPHPHIALNGAKYEAEAISRIIYGKSLLEEFKKFSIPPYLKRNRRS